MKDGLIVWCSSHSSGNRYSPWYNLQLGAKTENCVCPSLTKLHVSLALCDWRMRSDRCVLTTSALVSFHLPFSNRTLDEIPKIGIIRECFRVCFKSLLQDYVDTRQVLHKPLSTSAGRKHTCCNSSNIHPKFLGKKEKKNSAFYSYLLWRVCFVQVVHI